LKGDAGRRRSFFDRVWVALVWRYLSHSLMLGLAMLNEMRAAPKLPDSVLCVVPYTKWVADHNYGLWLLAYFPPALWLWRLDRHRFLHFLYLGGVLSLVRGVCILMTGLGPVVGEDVNAGMSMATATHAWWALVNPVGALLGDAPNIYLTKDLFFSGHTSTTFLLLLYCWSKPRLRWLALAGHLFVGCTVFLAHLHYTIDVGGAYAITYTALVGVNRRFPIDGGTAAGA